jgi:cholesterol oxidase
MGSFPRSPHDMANNFWNVERGQPDKPAATATREMHGLFDVRRYHHMDAVVSAGLGGGSLIYANVFLQPPDEVFDENWPESCKKEALQPYYEVAKSVLGARPIPQNDDPNRRVVRTELFQQFAKEVKLDSKLLDINVFFGNDFDKPTNIGEQEKNRYGALQTSCIYCAECDVGCNTHSKNTLDLNYLFVAEHKYKTRIETEVLAEKIIPLNADGDEDVGADGKHGYKVCYLDLKDNKKQCSIITRRVIVSAGTLGSNELLLRCRDSHKTLPNINQNLGKFFSGNGDFLSFVVDGNKPANPNYGPVITQGVDHYLFKNFNKQHAFIMEDAGYPNFVAWYTEILKPGISGFSAFFRTVKIVLYRIVHRLTTGRISYLLSELMQGDVSFGTSVLLCMGIDRSDGVMQLDNKGYLRIHWPYRNSLPLYNAILALGERFKEFVDAKAFVPLPTWLLWPKKRNVTVHALGGCRLADDPEKGVVSATPESMGQVFGYKGLYVADGAILPTAVGANPVATICALSERVAEGITGLTPDDDL